MELTEFLKARLDEDEAAAKAAAAVPNASDGRWELAYGPRPTDWRFGVINETGNQVVHNDGVPDAAIVQHIARHDPARALREVEAKRAIVAAYEDQADRSLPEGVYDGRDDNERDCDEAMKCALKEAIQHLAAVWSDHPDYDPAWR